MGLGIAITVFVVGGCDVISLLEGRVEILTPSFATGDQLFIRHGNNTYQEIATCIENRTWVIEEDEEWNVSTSDLVTQLGMPLMNAGNTSLFGNGTVMFAVEPSIPGKIGRAHV